MILDRGIAEIFARSNMAPKGEKPIWTETLRFCSWYAELSFETSPVWQTERRLAQKADARIRIAQCREIRQGDTVIISATPIPGNEKSISRVIDQLYRCGANVIYKALAEVHVSGHACQEELKLMHALVKPKYFIPVHGEYRMLWQHAVLAESMGMNSTDIVLPETGQVIEMNQEGLYLAEQIPTGAVLVDGLGIGDVGNVVLRDRKHLSQDGLIIVVMAINRDDQRLVSGPDIISRGFIYVRENEDIIENTRDVVRQILSQSSLAGEDWPALKNRIKDELHRFIFEKIKRNPMILPIILDV